MAKVLERLKQLSGRWGASVAGLLVLALLAATPLGSYLEERLYLTPFMKARAILGQTPRLDARIRLVLVDDRSVKALGAPPTFEDWERITEQLFDLGFKRVLLQEPPNLAAQVGQPAPRRARSTPGFLGVAVVDTLGVKSSRAMAAGELPDRLSLVGGRASDAADLLPVPAVIGPAPATFDAIDGLGLNNVDDGSTVPVGARLADGRVLPLLALLAAGQVRWDAHGMVSSSGRIPSPADGRFHVDFVSLTQIADKAMPVLGFYDHAGHVLKKLPTSVKDRLKGGDVAILLPAAYSGSRYVVSPIEGTVPAYLSLVSMANAALHNAFVYAPLPHGATLLAWVAALLALTVALPVRFALPAVASLTGVAVVAFTLCLQFEGWFLPCAQMTLVAAAVWSVRAAQHHLATLGERTKLAQEMDLGRTVQGMLLPREREGTIGPWQYRVSFRPYAAMAGDWFQIFKTTVDGREVGLVAIGDVVGKGPSAALLTATIAGLWNEHASQWSEGEIEPKRFLRAVGQTIHRTFGGQQYSTVALALIEPERIHIAAFASPSWIRLVPGVHASSVKTPSPGPLGLESGAAEVDLIELTPQPGELFFAHTDGVLDGPRGPRRFNRAVAKATAPGADQDVFAWVEEQAKAADQGDSLPDDVTLLMLRYTGEASGGQGASPLDPRLKLPA